MGEASAECRPRQVPRPPHARSIGCKGWGHAVIYTPVFFSVDPVTSPHVRNHLVVGHVLVRPCDAGDVIDRTRISAQAPEAHCLERTLMAVLRLSAPSRRRRIPC